MTTGDILSRLQGVKGGGGQWSARCPAHDDRRNSLSISTGQDGRILLRCHAGCSVDAIAGALGLSVKDLFEDQQKRPQERPQVVAVYDYRDASGRLLAQKLRRADKSFSWRRPDGKGGWIYNRQGVPHSLYIAGTLSSGAVFVCEGEKDADNLHRLGCDAASGADGAGPGKWRKEYTEQLRGCSVCVLGDNDGIGRDYAQETAAALYGTAASVRLLDLSKVWPDIPEHGDVSDLIAWAGDEKAGELLAGLVAATPLWTLEAATPTKEAGPVRKPDKNRPQLVRACDVPYEPPRWTIAPYFQRGKGTLVQGDNGTGKTAFLCAIAAHVTTGEPLLGLPITSPGDVVFLSVEDDLPVLRGRIEASGGDLTRCHFMTNAAGLTFTSPEVEEAVKAVKAVMIIFDPIQAFMGAGIDMFRPNETRPELAKLFEMCDRNDCACAIVSHMGKTGDKSPVNRSLGSVDIPAAMRSILELTCNPDNEEERIMVHVKCSNAPRGQSIVYTIGDRGGVHWVGFSPMTVEDLAVINRRKDRKEKGVPYENEPLVQVFNQFITDRPGGGFWSYADLKSEGAKILGFPPYSDINDLRQRLDGGLAREMQAHDGLIVTHGAKGKGNVRGVRVEKFQQPQSFQTKMTEG